MTFMTWDDQLRVQVDEIDEQHQGLFAIVNKLHDAIEAKRPNTAINETLVELTNYAIEHFATEERYFALAGYPLAPEHKELHQMFVAKVKELRWCSNGRDPEALAAETLQFLSKWLLNHLATSDQDFGAYLQTHPDVLVRS